MARLVAVDETALDTALRRLTDHARARRLQGRFGLAEEAEALVRDLNRVRVPVEVEVRPVTAHLHPTEHGEMEPRPSPGPEPGPERPSGRASGGPDLRSGDRIMVGSPPSHTIIGGLEGRDAHGYQHADPLP